MIQPRVEETLQLCQASLLGEGHFKIKPRVEETLQPSKATLLGEGHSKIKPSGLKMLLALVGISSKRRKL